MRYATLTSFCCLLLVLLLSAPAHALSLVGDLLSGWSTNAELDLNYTAYSEEENGEQLSDDQSFTRRYRLMFSQKQLFNKGTAGHYDLGIGGEFASINYDSMEQSRNISDFKRL